ncbi:MAG: ATP-binding protein, partial [Planctomycetota bacterium]
VQMQVDPAACRVRVDALHMEQALVALLTNAIQASAPDQSVRVWVRPAPETRGAWQLAVEDDGVGIRPEIREAIFLPYFTTKPDGNGIGLAIANKVVRTHGGRLTVESEPARGSRFLALLPGLVMEPD